MPLAPMSKKLTHINRRLTEEERQQAATIRQAVQQEFPPKTTSHQPPPPGIPSLIQQARKRRGVTRYELGQAADVPSTIVRAIEEGKDVPLSQFQAVVAALGLTMELVKQS
jgi:DNA-binding XRE family transcriptional regulator